MQGTETKTEYKRALIYCRVSGNRQVVEGHGLESQEYRSAEKARGLGLEVASIFPDGAVSGSLFDRPAMNDLIAFMDKHPREKFVIIFDDLKRFARDLEVHLKLKIELVKKRNARLECLNFKFEDSPHGRFIEYVMAAAAQLEREQNAIQVKDKMRARFDSGYWPFAKPPGLKRIKDPIHGKVLVPDEPLASIYKDAIEKYRVYELNTLQEVQGFILRQYALKDIERKLSLNGVSRILSEVLYSGYMECKKWGLPIRKAQHEGFISFETYQAVQEKLAKSAKPRLRKDYSADFPLRNFVLCSICKKPYTASWHRGRNKNRKYAHYWCKTKGCDFRNKAVDGGIMEKRFETMLVDMRPSGKVLSLLEVVLKEIWATRQKNEAKAKSAIQKEMSAIQGKIEAFTGRIASIQDQKLVEHYEKEIVSLHDKKTALEAEFTKTDYSSDQFGTAAGVVFSYLKKPDIQWQNPSFNKKRLLLNMYFSRGIPYNRKTGFGTPELPLVIATISQKDVSKSKMVELAGVAPASKSHD